jgi:hypothetical protein
MAEQSIGMATGTGIGFGDGNVGAGYPSSRMTAMETKTLSEGVMNAISSIGINSTTSGILRMTAGSAIVGGYFYENTGTVDINLTSLANAAYNIVIIVNNTAGAINVSRSAAGTTVGSYTVRLAVATAAQLVGQTYLQLGTVTVTGGLITASTTDYNKYATTAQLPLQIYSYLSGGTATLTNVNTSYDITNYSAGSNGLLMTADTSAGTIRVLRDGLYMIGSFVTFGTASTGSRTVQLKVNGTVVQRTMMTPGAATSVCATTFLQILVANDLVNVAANTLTTAAQSVTDSLFTVSRA